jgi:hypothetical protein
MHEESNVYTSMDPPLFNEFVTSDGTSCTPIGSTCCSSLFDSSQEHRDSSSECFLFFRRGIPTSGPSDFAVPIHQVDVPDVFVRDR